MSDIDALREELERQDKLIKRLLLCVSDILCGANSVVYSKNDHEIRRLADIIMREDDIDTRVGDVGREREKFLAELSISMEAAND